MDDEHLTESADDGIVEELAEHLLRLVDHESAHIDLAMQVRRLLQKRTRSLRAAASFRGGLLLPRAFNKAAVSRLDVRLEAA